MDERTLREIYLPAFETAVKEGKPATLMCAYPKLNGVHCSDSKKLLTDILRDEWGYEGLVVTDWGAMDDRREAFKAGCDLNMPGGSRYMEKDVIRAVRDGSLDEKYIDACAERVLKLVFRAEETLREEYTCDFDAHHELAKNAAIEGAVLLKNEESMLPLDEDENIAVIGYMAKDIRFQGSGSSHINPTKLPQPLDFFKNAIYAEGCDAKGDTNEKLLAEAAEAARKAKYAVVFAGLPGNYESEGFDRSDMKMPEGHLRMIDTVCEANPNTAVVLLCGAPVECLWADKVKSVLYMGLPGQAGAEAIYDIIFGWDVPSGKLAESWPYAYEDCVSSSYYGKTRDALYLEGIYEGYRYYDKAGKDVRFPFGFGLSYTTFELSDMKIEGSRVSVKVENTGDGPGAEVVQLYIEGPKDGIHRPLRELKHFAKVYLQSGEDKEVSFELKDRDFAVWDGAWKVQKGEYTVCVGTSSRDLPLRETVWKEGADIPREKESWYDSCSGIPSLADLEDAMGREYEEKTATKGSFTTESTVAEMKDSSLVMKMMYNAVVKIVTMSLGKETKPGDPEYRMYMESSVGSPIRSLAISGGIKGGVIPGLVEMANGRFFKGIARMIKG